MKSNRVLNRVIFVLIIAIASLLMTQNVSLAANSPYLNPPEARESSLSIAATEIGGLILAIAQVIGASVAIIMLIFLAIKYISSAPNDRAEIKKHAVVYVVGAVLLFAASGILGIIRGFAKGAFGGADEYVIEQKDGKTYYYNIKTDPEKKKADYYIIDATGEKWVFDETKQAYVLQK